MIDDSNTDCLWQLQCTLATTTAMTMTMPLAVATRTEHVNY